jgi:hypothetical protein
MATDAAWLKRKNLQQGRKRKSDLTLTGLLMEEVSRRQMPGDCAKWDSMTLISMPSSVHADME